MNRKEREKRHDKYYAIEAYQILARKSFKDMAGLLGITERTYKEKINGYSDFSATQGSDLAKHLGASQDQIFLT